MIFINVISILIIAVQFSQVYNEDQDKGSSTPEISKTSASSQNDSHITSTSPSSTVTSKYQTNGTSKEPIPSQSSSTSTTTSSSTIVPATLSTSTASTSVSTSSISTAKPVSSKSSSTTKTTSSSTSVSTTLPINTPSTSVSTLSTTIATPIPSQSSSIIATTSSSTIVPATLSTSTASTNVSTSSTSTAKPVSSKSSSTTKTTSSSTILPATLPIKTASTSVSTLSATIATPVSSKSSSTTKTTSSSTSVPTKPITTTTSTSVSTSSTTVSTPPSSQSISTITTTSTPASVATRRRTITTSTSASTSSTTIATSMKATEMGTSTPESTSNPTSIEKTEHTSESRTSLTSTTKDPKLNIKSTSYRTIETELKENHGPKGNSTQIIIVLLLMLTMILLICVISFLAYKRRKFQLSIIRALATSQATKRNRKTNLDKSAALSEMEMKTTKGKISPFANLINDKMEKMTLEEIFEKIPYLNDTKKELKDFKAYFEKLKDRQFKDLEEEYERLKHDSTEVEVGLKLTKFSGKHPLNLKKNKFLNILPFDQNRVILTGKMEITSYINANYIPSLENTKETEYIASQGPIESTLDSFILMIWEQNVSCIVMLTQTYEEGKFKCMQYWPAKVGSTLKFGFGNKFIVTLESETEEISHFERKFSINNSAANVKRTVHHIHMHTWSDFSAPNLTHFDCALTRFYELMESSTKAPYLVHCSAGVGRTGTFICIDRIVRQLKNGAQCVDIYKTVLELRAYRNFLVQRQAQYKFIHEFMDFFISRFTSEKEDLGEIS